LDRWARGGSGNLERKGWHDMRLEKPHGPRQVPLFPLPYDDEEGAYRYEVRAYVDSHSKATTKESR
jgi:hypothetical protein